MFLGVLIIVGDLLLLIDNSDNGYCKFFWDKLRLEGWKVNMVGNFCCGKMNDNVGLL